MLSHALRKTTCMRRDLFWAGGQRLRRVPPGLRGGMSARPSHKPDHARIPYAIHYVEYISGRLCCEMLLLLSRQFKQANTERTPRRPHAAALDPSFRASVPKVAALNSTVLDTFHLSSSYKKSITTSTSQGRVTISYKHIASAQRTSPTSPQ